MKRFLGIYFGGGFLVFLWLFVEITGMRWILWVTAGIGVVLILLVPIILLLESGSNVHNPYQQWVEQHNANVARMDDYEKAQAELLEHEIVDSED